MPKVGVSRRRRSDKVNFEVDEPAAGMTIRGMGDDKAALCTLTSIDRGLTLRLPDVRVLATLPDRRVVTASFGIYPLLAGTSADCDIILSDPRVSRRHCELRLTERGVLIRDLGSKNGTLIGGAPIVEAFLPPGASAFVGDTELVIHPTGEGAVLPLSKGTSFGECVGQSLPMRALFATLERAAPTNETILLLGESGTGKELLARAIHGHSRCKDGPFVIVDCGAIAPNLIEGELFGYVRGAFTGAAAPRAGLLEQANGGTLFVDELGELPLDLQPKLLRAIESRQIRKLGSNDWQPFNSRVIAATHRNLRQKAAEGSFREDLYYRIAVVEVHVPALREHKDDIELLVERFLAARDPPSSLADLPPHTLALLKAYDWPGNVRELRNIVARMVLFPELLPTLIGPPRAAGGPTPAAPLSPEKAAAQGSAPPPAEAAEDASGGDVERLGMLLELPLQDARQVVMERFERRYLAVKLRQHGGNISRVAEVIGASRQLVYRLIERYALRVK